METVTIHQAKTSLSKLIHRAESGEEVVIARGSRPVARLVPYQAKKKTLVFGLASGKLEIAADFDAPLPAEVLASFEGDV